jgi:hypothetical protein
VLGNVVSAPRHVTVDISIKLHTVARAISDWKMAVTGLNRSMLAVRRGRIILTRRYRASGRETHAFLAGARKGWLAWACPSHSSCQGASGVTHGLCI